MGMGRGRGGPGRGSDIPSNMGGSVGRGHARGEPPAGTSVAPVTQGRGRGINRRESMRAGNAVGATRHERELKGMKSSNQELMRKQMNLLRVQIKKNAQELERLKARDGEKEIALSVFDK